MLSIYPHPKQAFVSNKTKGMYQNSENPHQKS